MKITKSKLEQIIAEEVKAFVNESGGQYAKMMSQHALDDAYRSRTNDKKEDEKAKKFRQAQQKDPKDKLPDWMMAEDQSKEEVSDLLQVILVKVKTVATELYHGEIDAKEGAEQLDEMIKGLVPTLQEMGIL